MRKRSASRVVGLLALLPWGAGLEAAQPAALAPVVTAAVRNVDTKESGAGFIIRQGDGCTLVTAAHVLDGAVDVQIETSDRPAETAKVRYLVRGTDVATMPLKRPADSCPPAPSEAMILQAIQGSRGTLLVGSPGGGSSTLDMSILKVERDSLVLAPSSTMVKLTEGSSGGVVVMNGVPVAIQSDKETQENGRARAIRLDHAANVLGPAVLSLTVVVTSSGDSLTRANDLLRQAMVSRPLGDLGQNEAIAALARAGKGVAGLDLSGISFAKATVDHLDAQTVDLRLGDLSGSRFSTSNFAGSDLAFATLAAAHLVKTDLQNSRAAFAQAQGADFQGSSLRKSSWIAANLAGASFKGTDIDGASFAFADLRGADFTGAVFKNLVLIGSDLRGAHFDQTSATSIDVTGAVFDDRTFAPALWPRLCASKSERDIQVRIFAAKPGAEGTHFEHLSDYRGPIRLDRAGDRFFPACPRRFNLIGAAEWSMVETNSGEQTEVQKALHMPAKTSADPETITDDVRVDVAGAVLDLGHRREFLRTVLDRFLADQEARGSALSDSNAIYRARTDHIVAAIGRQSGAPSGSGTFALTYDSYRALAEKANVLAVDVAEDARARLDQEEKDRARTDGVSNGWARLFPPDTVWQDLDAKVAAAFARWQTARRAALPQRLAIARFDVPGLMETSVDTVMKPYDAAPSAERDRIASARKADCARMVSLRFDSKDQPEHDRLAAQLGYGGPNEFACQEFVWKSERARVLDSSWFRQGMTLLDGPSETLIAIEGTPPASMASLLHADSRSADARVLLGTIARLAALPVVPGAGSKRRLLIVLRDVKTVAM